MCVECSLRAAAEERAEERRQDEASGAEIDDGEESDSTITPESYTRETAKQANGAGGATSQAS